MRKLFFVLPFILIILVVIYYSQEELIKNYYYEYTNKIGYKDLIIGSSSDIIEKHCQEKPDEPGWSGPMYICYNDQSWMYKFIIRNNKIQSYFMAEMYDDDAKPEVKFRHNSVSISPIINTLDRRYVLDKEPETNTDSYNTKETEWIFGNNSVFVELHESKIWEFSIYFISR